MNDNAIIIVKIQAQNIIFFPCQIARIYSN